MARVRLKKNHNKQCTQSKTPIQKRPLSAAVALALSLSISPAYALSISVDSASDTATGVCRLRDAIIAANTDAIVEGCTAGSGADIIRLLPVAGSTIQLAGTRLPTVTSDITIQGESVTIDAGGSSGLLDVSDASLTVSYLSLVNGADTTGAGIRVRNGASLTLSGSTVSGNTATENGGGISVENGGETVALINSTVSGNEALGSVADTGIGGGIFAARPVAKDISISLTNSTLSGNTASGPKGKGGGLGFPYFSSAGLRIDVSILNSTLFGNTATYAGGGMYNSGPFARPASFSNSIISNNSVTSSPYYGPDCYGSFQLTGTTSFIGNGSGCGSSSGTTISGNPMLAPLADNGGPTKTHAPLVLSPVIDATNTNCTFLPDINFAFFLDFTSDQRGLERHDGKCDLGAVEVAGAALQTGPNFVVNSSDDPFKIDLRPSPSERFLNGNGHCNVAPGECTLRDAILAANRSGDATTITFSGDLATPIKIELAAVQPLAVLSDLTIQGSSVEISQLLFDGTFLTRQLEVESARLTLNGINISDGFTFSGPGAGILATKGATLELINSPVSGNQAQETGGGIYVSSDSSASLIGSDLTGNKAGYNGGGIFVAQGGSLTIDDSTLSRNTAGLTCSLPEVCGGGAIALDAGTLLVSNSTFSLNRVSFGQGGGIYAHSNSDLTIRNSTLASNTTETGGAIWISSSSLELLNSTLSGNTANAGGGVYASSASTIDIISSTLSENEAQGIAAGLWLKASTVTLSNSIIAKNLVAEDCVSSGGSVSILGVSLIEDGGATCGLTPGPNLLTGDPGLGPLAENGGPTLTHLPALISPVLDAGDSSINTASSDQRGYARVFGDDIDLGAVEVTFSSGTIALQNTSVQLNEAAGPAQFMVTRSGGSEREVSVTVNSANGTAEAGSDFDVINATTITFADGDSTAQLIEIPITDDNVFELDEDFSIILSAPTGGATLGDSQGTVTILNDDARPPAGALAISQVTLMVDEDSPMAELTVTRTGGSFGEVSATVNSIDGSALAGDDFTGIVAGSVSFADGATSDQIIQVPIIDDDVLESDETFSVQISNPTGAATLGNASAVITIKDNDASIEETIFLDGFEQVVPDPE